MRRRRRNNSAIIFLIALGFIIWMINHIIRLILENMWLVYSLLGVGVLVLFVMIGLRLYRVNQYKQTPYYSMTQTPWTNLNHPGVRFESEIYDRLVEYYPQAKYFVNALIPRSNAVNEYFEIDIIMISLKGIFILELKDWQGFIYGNLESEKWTVGRSREDQRHAASVYSPYLQNQKHIEDLNKIHPHPYIGHVIFSQRANIGDGVEGISHFDGFIERHERLEVSLDAHEIQHHAAAISEKLDSSKLPDHVERIKYNEEKYRKYR